MRPARRACGPRRDGRPATLDAQAGRAVRARPRLVALRDVAAPPRGPAPRSLAEQGAEAIRDALDGLTAPTCAAADVDARRIADRISIESEAAQPALRRRDGPRRDAGRVLAAAVRAARSTFGRSCPAATCPRSSSAPPRSSCSPAGALFTLAAMAVAAGGRRPLGGSGLGFAAWALLPYLVLAGGLGRFWSHRARLAGLAGTAVVVLGAAALYADAVWLHPDAQGGLAFVTVPVLQLSSPGRQSRPPGSCTAAARPPDGPHRGPAPLTVAAVRASRARSRHRGGRGVRNARLPRRSPRPRPPRRRRARRRRRSNSVSTRLVRPRGTA